MACSLLIPASRMISHCSLIVIVGVNFLTFRNVNNDRLLKYLYYKVISAKSSNALLK